MRVIDATNMAPVDYYPTGADCDFCGESKPCAGNIRTKASSGRELTQNVCICHGCAAGIAALLLSKGTLTEDGQMEV